ncbi:hypothetical protein BJ166DRAFT_504453 [Pestalotiopsis sp. NC0098]|nr:hypothetical protein BJ166DRAFT_504453 [Pestalotiopsis sp. NC0098]
MNYEHGLFKDNVSRIIKELSVENILQANASHCGPTNEIHTGNDDSGDLVAMGEMLRPASLGIFLITCHKFMSTEMYSAGASKETVRAAITLSGITFAIRMTGQRSTTFKAVVDTTTGNDFRRPEGHCVRQGRCVKDRNHIRALARLRFLYETVMATFTAAGQSSPADSPDPVSEQLRVLTPLTADLCPTITEGQKGIPDPVLQLGSFS